MIRLKFARILLAAMLVSGSVVADSLNVVSMNLEWFPGQTPQAHWIAKKRHIRDVKSAIAKAEPDILIATEVCEEDALRSALKGVPGLTLDVISNFVDVEDGGDRRNQQIAIASKLVPVAGWAEPWEQTLPSLRRGFTFAALENPSSGRLILVYGLHLKSNRSGTPEEVQQNYDARDASVDQLLAHMKRMEAQFADRGVDGWIVAGDFNTNHDGQFGDHVIEKLVAAGFCNSWRNTDAADRHTWKARGTFEPTTFDYIMVKNLGEPDASVMVTPDQVSDHNAVRVHVELPKAPAAETVASPPPG